MVDRDLLRKAYPSGWLATEGILSVGGWRCLGAGNEDGSVWSTGADAPSFDITARGYVSWAFRIDLAEVRRLIAAGYLLPRIDPAETATWACVKADLAKALWGGREPIEVTFGRTRHGEWELSLHANPADMHMIDFDHIFRVDTDDPALALVLARIQLREQAEGGSDG